jgi:hypothetical protein
MGSVGTVGSILARNGAKTAKEGRGGIWGEVLSLTSSLREESKKVLEACLSV